MTGDKLNLRLPFDYEVIGYLEHENGMAYVAVQRWPNGEPSRASTSYANFYLGDVKPNGARACFGGMYDLTRAQAMRNLVFSAGLERT